MIIYKSAGVVQRDYKGKLSLDWSTEIHWRYDKETFKFVPVRIQKRKGYVEKGYY